MTFIAEHLAALCGLAAIVCLGVYIARDGVARP